MVDQNDSMSALSTLEATRPIDPSSPACRSRWPKSQDVYCAPLSACTIVPTGRRCHLAMSSAPTTISVVRRSEIDQPTMRRLVDHRRAVYPAIAGSMLRDVAEPEPIRTIGAELPLNQVFVRGGVGLPAAPLATMRDAREIGEPHQPRDTLAGHVRAHPKPQFRMHARRPVGAARARVDLPDPGRQRIVGDLPRRGTSGTPAIEAGRGDLRHPAGHRDGHPVNGELLDQPELYFGSTFSRAK